MFPDSHSGVDFHNSAKGSTSVTNLKMILKNVTLSGTIYYFPLVGNKYE